MLSPLQKLRPFIIVILIVLNIFLSSAFLGNLNRFDNNNLPELAELKGTENFGELKIYFTKLANEKGAPYAYEVLKRAKIAPNTDMHLLGHVVGEILYLQEGARGMRYCTQDFRNACSHTIVVGLFSEKGIAALPEIAQACKKAPGGKGAYNMCFHGLGHGVLAFVGYELPKAVEVCSEIKKGREDGNEYPECVGGTVMEIISGGDHDKELWQPKHNEHVETNDPLYPCNADFIEDEVKSLCYTYLTPQLIAHAGGNMGNPTDKDFEKAFAYCDLLPKNDLNRDICFSGFGKEFVVLARARDIRSIDQMTDEELKKVESWCSLAVSDGRIPCLRTALASIYWGGENDRAASIRFCNILSAKTDKDFCFTELIRSVAYYISDTSYKKSFCREVPQEYSADCKEVI